MSEVFDLAVIGAGPAGYVAAIKAAQLGKKVVCIDKDIGGTCLNVGCIPSKTLLNSSFKYYDAIKHFKDHGVEFTSIALNLNTMMSNKDKTITELRNGIEGLFRKNKVNYIKGIASFESTNTLSVISDLGERKITATDIVIATGSEAMSLPNIAIDEKYIVTSTGALSLNNIPKSMIVLGGGVIGLEMGSVWSRLGTKVQVLEFADRVIPGADLELSAELKKILEKQGFSFLLNHKCKSASLVNRKVSVEAENDGKILKLECDVLLVAIGRKAYTANLGLEKVGIAVDARGKVKVDEKFRTEVKNIYAIGDVIDGVMLAHKASEEGIAVAEIIAGQHGHVNYGAIPSVVYTHPEVAWIGATEEELKSRGVKYKVGKFPYLANSRARTHKDTDGFVKILACAKSDEVLGCHIISSCAGELISEFALAMEFKASSEDIARTSHPHPSFSEAVKEAALGTFFKPIHF